MSKLNKWTRKKTTKQVNTKVSKGAFPLINKNKHHKNSYNTYKKYKPSHGS